MPLAAVQLGAVLEAAGHEVTVQDFMRNGQQVKTPHPPELRNHGLPPLLHQGTPLEDCEAWLSEHVQAFDVVGLHACDSKYCATSGKLHKRSRTPSSASGVRW